MDAVARAKFSCPACGAEATWNPARQALICGFCGTTSPAQLVVSPTGEHTIQEHDLGAALRRLPDSCRGWQAKKTQVKCQSCQAISVFDPARVGQRCEFCGSASLVPYEEIKEAIRPESLLPMKIAEDQVRDLIKQWIGSRWFAPNKLKTKSWTDTVKGLYVPYWTFDAKVHADWTAEAGYYYYETESYTDSQGRRQTRQVRRVRWVPAAGQIDHFFDDEVVAASRGVHAALLDDVEPFPVKELVPYDAGFLAGWVVERYQIDLVAAAHAARERMNRAVEQMCSRQVPGDTQRNLRVAADYSKQTFKHILVPVWLLTYVFGTKSYQVLANGVTGEMAGEYPKSWVKILFAILGVLGALAVLVWLFARP